MAGVVYEAVPTDSARAFLDELAGPAQERVWRLIRILEIDPHLDGRLKFAIDAGGQIENVYAGPEFWIFYHIADNAFVVFDAIARAWFPTDWTPPSTPNFNL